MGRANERYYESAVQTVFETVQFLAENRVFAVNDPFDDA